MELDLQADGGDAQGNAAEPVRDNRLPPVRLSLPLPLPRLSDKPWLHLARDAVKKFES
jgi:hypothetical protein